MMKKIWNIRFLVLLGMVAVLLTSAAMPLATAQAQAGPGAAQG